HDAPHVRKADTSVPPVKREPCSAPRRRRFRGCRGWRRAILRLLPIEFRGARPQYHGPRQSHRDDAAPYHALCTPRPARRFLVEGSRRCQTTWPALAPTAYRTRTFVDCQLCVMVTITLPFL